MALVFRFAARSDAGVVRSKNDDSGYAGRYFAVVADGMGGHAGGDIASASTVLDLAHLDTRGFAEPDTVLPDEIQTANSFLSKLVQTNPKLSGMGTTITAALITGEKLQFAHIGDSRAYRLKKGRFRQVSHDHTFVQRLVDEGRLDPEAAEYHPHKNVLMRVLGDVDASPELDITSFPLESGERWLLCSDGLNAVVSDRLIEQKLRSDEELEKIVEDLVNLTIEGGAPDNVTVVCVEVVEADEDDLSDDSDSLPLSEEAVAAATGHYAPTSDPADDDGDYSTMELDVVPVVNREALTGHERSHSELSPLAAAMVQRKLGVRTHLLVGAANQATDTGVLEVVSRNVDEHPMAALLTGQPLRPVRHTYSEMLGESAEGTEGHTPSQPSTAEPTEEQAAEEPDTDHDDEDEDDYSLQLDEDELAALQSSRRRRAWFLPTFVALLAILIAVVTFLGYLWTQTQYYVGEDEGEVAVYTGVSQSLGPISLSDVDEYVGIEVAELPSYDRDRLESGIFAEDREHAAQIVENLERIADSEEIGDVPEDEEDAEAENGDNESENGEDADNNGEGGDDE